MKHFLYAYVPPHHVMTMSEEKERENKLAPSMIYRTTAALLLLLEYFMLGLFVADNLTLAMVLTIIITVTELILIHII
jgi:hypothetical protein